MKPPSSEEAPVGRLVAFTGARAPVEWLMPRTRLVAHALAGVPVEDVIGRAGSGSGVDIAHTLACVLIEVLVGGTGDCRNVPLATHTLAGVDVQLLVGTTHIRNKYVCSGKQARGNDWNRRRVAYQCRKEVTKATKAELRVIVRELQTQA